MVRLFHLSLMFSVLASGRNILSNVAAEMVEYSIESWQSAQQDSTSSSSSSSSGEEQQKLNSEQIPTTDNSSPNDTSSNGNNAYLDTQIKNTDHTEVNNNHKKKNNGNSTDTNNTKTSNANKKNENINGNDTGANNTYAKSDQTSNRNANDDTKINVRNSHSNDDEVNLNANQSDGGRTSNNNKRVQSNNNKQTSRTKQSSTATQPQGSTNSRPPCSHEPCVEDNALRAVQIKSMLMEVSERFDLNNPESPQYQAAAWIIYGDPLRLSPADPSLFQRYSATVLYLATNGDKWLVCSANTTSPCGPDTGGSDLNNNATTLSCYYYDGCTNSSSVVVETKKSKRELTKKTPSHGDVRWLSGQSECEWYGLHCDSEASITTIDLNDNNLSGQLPPEIKTFCKVKNIKMAGNKISGRLPTELRDLYLLKNLRLGRNMFTGVLPLAIYQLVTLERLDVHANMLSGGISTRIGDLKELRRLQLSQNLFTGTIPRQIGELGKLRTLQLQFNEITGNVPNRVCVLRYQYLDQFETDCASPPNPPLVNCKKTCCTACFSENERPMPPTSPPSLSPMYPVNDIPTPKTFSPTDQFVSSTPAPSPVEKKTNPPTPEGTALCFTTPEDRAKEIIKVLLTVTNLTTIEDDTSPQRQALDWIVNTDDLILCPDSPNLVQRYLLAAFYYATAGESWLKCSAEAQSTCPDGERWLSVDSECFWYGNTCTTKDNISEIKLDKNNLIGRLIPEIGSLQDLDGILLSTNNLTGTIPNELGNLSKLTTLELQDNDLTGSVPESLCALSNSQVIAVDCQEVTCKAGCCTCYPLGSKLATSEETSAHDLTVGLVPLTNATSSNDDAGGILQQSIGDDDTSGSLSPNSSKEPHVSPMIPVTARPTPTPIATTSVPTSSFTENVITSVPTKSPGKPTNQPSVNGTVYKESNNSTDGVKVNSKGDNSTAQGKESASVPTAATTSGRSAKAPTYIFVVMAALLFSVGFVLLLRAKFNKLRRNPWKIRVNAPPSDAFNLHSMSNAPGEHDDDDVESRKGYLSSIESSNEEVVKNQNMGSSDISSKVKDCDVARWWCKTRR